MGIKCPGSSRPTSRRPSTPARSPGFGARANLLAQLSPIRFCNTGDTPVHGLVRLLGRKVSTQDLNDGSVVLRRGRRVVQQLYQLISRRSAHTLEVRTGHIFRVAALLIKLDQLPNVHHRFFLHHECGERGEGQKPSSFFRAAAVGSGSCFFTIDCLPESLTRLDSAALKAMSAWNCSGTSPSA